MLPRRRRPVGIQPDFAEAARSACVQHEGRTPWRMVIDTSAVQEIVPNDRIVMATTMSSGQAQFWLADHV